jgi:hypothetical protein
VAGWATVRAFRDRDRMLIPGKNGKCTGTTTLRRWVTRLRRTTFLRTLLVNIRVGLASVADALSDGKVSIDADGTLHLPAFRGAWTAR